MIEHRMDAVFPVDIHAFAAELVDFQASTGGGRRTVGRTGRCVAEPDELPASSGRIPRERAVATQVRRHIDDRFQRNRCILWKRFEVRLTVSVASALSGLGLPLADTETAIERCGNGEERDVTVIAQHHLWLRQFFLDAPAAFECHFGRDQLLHRKFRGDPRTAGRGPACAVLQAEFKSEPCCLAGRVLHQVEPERTQVLGRAVWRLALVNRATETEDEAATDA